MMKNNQPLIYHPGLFFSLVFMLSGTFWFIAAYCSDRLDLQPWALLLALLGLLGPAIAAIIMALISGHSSFIHDYRKRLFDFSSITLSHLLFVSAVIFVTLISATAISLLFGFSLEQFRFSPGFMAMLPLAFIAPLLEELGWRTYAVDSLRPGRSLLSATLLFAILWAFWHVPLFFIHQTYQQGLYELGWLYVINFFVSIFPAAILSNWLYYKSGRSIPSVVIFHFMLVVSGELLQTAPQTKWIVTALLLAVCIMLIVIDRRFFFTQIKCIHHTFDALPRNKI